KLTRQTPVVRARAHSLVGTRSSRIYSGTWSAVSTWSDVWAWTCLRPCSSVCGSPEWTSSCCRRSSRPSSCSRTVSGDSTGDFGLDFRELLINFLFPRRFDVDQDESDGRGSPSCFLRTSVL